MLERYHWILLATVLAFLPGTAVTEELAVVEPGIIHNSTDSVDTNSYSVSQQPAEPLSLLDAIHYFEQISDMAWPALSGRTSLHPGDQHAEILQLRRRLFLLGDLSTDISDRPDLFDDQLALALKRFQSRHGLEVDGILGRRSRQALNISPQQRLQQLAVNLLRQEQFSLRASDTYIQVNIPEFRLRLYHQGSPALEMKTIVGRKTRETPVFDSEIDTMVINPSWYVPKSIAFRDILPTWQKNPDYLTEHNLKVITGWGAGIQEIPLDQVDWTTLYNTPQSPRLWEPPSDNNTLGQVKFLTPNRYAVYLHDTSAKSLFRHDTRAFSSGCIRLEQPRRLADAVIRLSQSGLPEHLDPLFDSDTTQRIRLQQPIPLHITYWTAWIDSDGLLQFRNDLYRRDNSDLAALKASHQSVTFSAN